MSGWRGWSVGAKLVTSSVVCLLLSIPLCGYGITIGVPAPDSKLEQIAGSCGLILLGMAVLLFLAGIVAALVEWMGRR